VIRVFQKLTSETPERPVSSLSPVPPKSHPIGVEGLTDSGLFEKKESHYPPVRPERPVSPANPVPANTL
jgi:hypothetical protein